MFANVFTKSTRDRWKGMAIAVVSLAALLFMAMGVYKEIDITAYASLPEALRSIMNIPDGADAAGLGIEVLYGFYGALTLAALALSMGSASLAGEERNGTIGLLLGNPKSRTSVLLSKMASMVLLTALGALFLWGAARIVAILLNVRLTGMKVAAYSVHLFINALFYGFLAMAIGGWTGNRGAASGATAGIMIISYIAVGIFPVIDGGENIAKAFPWYYFAGSRPLANGLDYGHLAVLLLGGCVFALIAVVGANRRDLKGQTVGVTLVDRLRNNPMTQKIANRLAGSTRVSRIWIKTASEHQGLLVVTMYVMFLLMGVLMGPIYSLMDEMVLKFTAQMPEELFALAGAGSGSMGTPEGFFEVETFGLMAPTAVILVGTAIGARGLAGEEERRTMGLLLANPIRRSRIVVEKGIAILILSILVGISTFAGVWIGSILGGLGIHPGNIAATSALATLVGMVFGALSLALSAATGRVRASVFGTVGAALALHLLNSFAVLNDKVAGYAKLSPFYYYLTNDPLETGMQWGHGAVLAVIIALLFLLSLLFFNRRDLRQTG